MARIDCRCVNVCLCPPSRLLLQASSSCFACFSNSIALPCSALQSQSHVFVAMLCSRSVMSVVSIRKAVERLSGKREYCERKANRKMKHFPSGQWVEG